VDLASVTPSLEIVQWAAEWQKDARLIEVIHGETRRVVRNERGILIVETHHGFVCANAGVDTSNNAPDMVTLLPVDPDESAQRLCAQFERAWGVRVGVIISDTFGRPWREGLVNVALGVAGLAPLLDYRGQPDTHGRTLSATVIAVADELASAAELVMGKMGRVPVALIQGFQCEATVLKTGSSARDLIRPAERDLFR
jgi:coenzyme F420-0:L-glutamate ligase / coenzyme F420-1:gamma-L-glutamate ligase